MPGRPSPAAVIASASGREPPSRKENADRACSSTYCMAQSYIPSTNQLLCGQIAKNPIKRSMAIKHQLYVPFSRSHSPQHPTTLRRSATAQMHESPALSSVRIQSRPALASALTSTLAGIAGRNLRSANCGDGSHCWSCLSGRRHNMEMVWPMRIEQRGNPTRCLPCESVSPTTARMRAMVISSFAGSGASG